MKTLFKLLILCNLLISFTLVKGQEVVGANLEWGEVFFKANSTSPVYPITLDIYTKDFPFSDNNQLVLMAYSKSNGKQVGVLTTRFTKTKKARRVESGNLKCSDNFKIDVFHEEYKNDGLAFSSWDAYDLNDYYFVLDFCCRPNSVQNVKYTSDNIFSIIVEVPSYKNSFTHNVIPNFKKEMNNFFYCKGTNFEIDFSAIDINNLNEEVDELRYSFVDLIKGVATEKTILENNFTYKPDTKYIQWASGYSLNKLLGNGNSLEINKNTGFISGKCNKTGKYSIAVKVEQFRNGKSQGYNMREYTFWVVDCPTVQVPKPILTVDGTNTSTHLFCLDAKVSLETDNVIGYVYEWKKDGNVVLGENSNKLSTKEEGTYTVTSINAQNCQLNQTSEPIELIIKNKKPFIVDRPHIVHGCFDKPALLTVKNNTFNREIIWKNYSNNTTTKSPTYSVTKSGLYEATYAPSGCLTDSSSERITVLIGTGYNIEPPKVTELIVCPGNSIFHKSKDFGPLGHFLTYKDGELVDEGSNTFFFTIPGKYVVFGGSGSCTTKLEDIEVVIGENCPNDDEQNIFIPDIVTANLDGVNEDFLIFNRRQYPDLEIFMYDTWGKLIYHGNEPNDLHAIFRERKTSAVYNYRIKLNRANMPDKIGRVIVVLAN